MKTENAQAEFPLHLAVKKQNLYLLKVLINENNTPVLVKDF